MRLTASARLNSTRYLPKTSQVLPSSKYTQRPFSDIGVSSQGYRERQGFGRVSASPREPSSASLPDMRWLWTFGKVPELEAEGIHEVSKRIVAMTEAERLLPSSPRIIDVRTAGEYAGGHVAGALHASFLPPWAWPGSVSPLLAHGVDPEATEIYVICLSAHRSIGALKWLQQQGYKHVKQLQGGMQAWRAKGLPEVKEAKQHTAEAASAAGEKQQQ